MGVAQIPDPAGRGSWPRCAGEVRSSACWPRERSARVPMPRSIHAVARAASDDVARSSSAGGRLGATRLGPRTRRSARAAGSCGRCGRTANAPRMASNHSAISSSSSSSSSPSLVASAARAAPGVPRRREAVSEVEPFLTSTSLRRWSAAPAALGFGEAGSPAEGRPNAATSRTRTAAELAHRKRKRVPRKRAASRRASAGSKVMCSAGRTRRTTGDAAVPARVRVRSLASVVSGDPTT